MERPTLWRWVLCQCSTSDFTCLGLSPQTTHQASHHSASSARVTQGQGLDVPVCGRHVQPTSACRLAGAHVLLLPSWGFYWSTYFLRGACPCLPQPQFTDMSGPETKASPTIFEKCGGKLAREGRDTTPWDAYRIPLPKTFRIYRFRHQGSKSNIWHSLNLCLVHILMYGTILLLWSLVRIKWFWLQINAAAELWKNLTNPTASNLVNTTLHRGHKLSPRPLS